MASQMLLSLLVAITGVMVVSQGVATSNYSLNTISVNFTDASKLCKREGGHLIDLSSANEMETARSLLLEENHNSAWVGIYVMQDKFTLDINLNIKKGLGWADNRVPEPVTGDSIRCVILTRFGLETRLCDENLHGVLCETPTLELIA